MTKERKILLLDGGGWNGVTTVQVNVINYLADKGHSLTVVLFDAGMQTDPVKYDRWPKRKGITYHIIKSNGSLQKALNQWALLRALSKLIACSHLLKNHTHFYAFEFEAGIIFFLYRKLFRRVIYLVHSIELYQSTSKRWLVRASMQNATYIITQDEIRKQELIRLYGLKDDRLLISINSSRLVDYIDNTPITLPEFVSNKKKILFIGSLIDEHCYPEVLDAARHIPDEFCLIIHGWGGGKYRELLNAVLQVKPENIWLSNLQLNDASKFKLYAATDVGLVTFNARYYNCKYAALSAGKLFDFMRVGKPVVASDIAGLGPFVRHWQIGETMQSTDEVFFKAKSVIDDYQRLASNAQQLFSRYEFDVHFDYVYGKFLQSAEPFDGHLSK